MNSMPENVESNGINTDIRHVLEVTTSIGCRVACSYCPQKKFVNAYRKRSDILRFDLDSLKSVLATVPKDVDIYFCGMSEPFLNSQCAEMMRFAWQKGHRIALDTSLVGMTASDLEILQDIPLLFLALHLPSDRGDERIEVNDSYLELLRCILMGGLRPQKLHLHYYGGKLHPKIVLPAAEQMPLFSRGGTIRVEDAALPARARGEIGCNRKHRYNVLLPNGDVLLCSTDWEMKHVLGNLKEMSYAALFEGKAFRDILAGMKDEKMDILCRFCESHTHDVDLKARVMNLIPNVQKKIRFVRAGKQKAGK